MLASSPLAKGFVLWKKGILIEIGASWEFLFVSMFKENTPFRNGK